MFMNSIHFLTVIVCYSIVIVLYKMIFEAEKNVSEKVEPPEWVKNIGIEYRFSCYEENNRRGCHLLGEYMQAVEKNAKGAFQLFKNNCDEFQFSDSCFKYARYLVAGNVCKSDIPSAIDKLTFSCDNDHPSACNLLGLLHYHENDPDKANKFMKKACDLAHCDSCFQLSGWHMGESLKGLKPALFPRDMSLALHYGLIACNLGEAHGCANVSRMYKLGDGTDKDKDKAAEFKRRAIGLDEARRAEKLYSGTG